MSMMDIRRRMLLASLETGLSVASVSTSAHTAVNLSSISWEDLKAYGDAIAADTAHSYSNSTTEVTFSNGQKLGVGDVKSVVLNGTVGILTFSNTTSYCFILGFRHNFAVEGTGIHFQFGKTGLGGTNVAFVDANYGTTTGATKFQMNAAAHVTGGWTGSYMYGTIIPAFYNAVPASLQSVMAATTKYTNNVGMNNDASSVTASSDSLFLIAEFELFGTRSTANTTEQSYQEQYAYYKAGAGKIKYKHDATGTAAIWWTRSARSETVARFISCRADGTSFPYPSNNSYGFAPIFSIGTAS